MLVMPCPLHWPALALVAFDMQDAPAAIAAAPFPAQEAPEPAATAEALDIPQWPSPIATAAAAFAPLARQAPLLDARTAVAFMPALHAAAISGVHLAAISAVHAPALALAAVALAVALLSSHAYDHVAHPQTMVNASAV